MHRTWANGIGYVFLTVTFLYANSQPLRQLSLMKASASGAFEAFMFAASHLIFLPTRNATFPNNATSVKRALYSKFALAAAPPRPPPYRRTASQRDGP